jgi:hypothetical protein
MITARRVLGLGALLGLLGFGTVVYFDLGYDTWVRTDVAPPSGSTHAGDMTESVLYQDEIRMERARVGRRTGFLLFGLGLVVTSSALVALRRSKRVSGADRAH